MEYFDEIKWVLIVIIIINQVAKSIRIYQLKKVDKNRIDAIGNYEKKSKNKYLTPPWKKIKEP